MSDRQPIVGPDPRELSDAEVATVAEWLRSAGYFVATGRFDERPTAERLESLSAVPLFLYRFLAVGHQVMVNEDERRWEADGERLAADVDDFLQTLGIGGEGE